MSFYSKIYSIKNIKVKVEHITDVENFIANFKVAGLEVHTDKDYFVVVLDPNHENIAWQTEHAVAMAYSTCKSFDLEIETDKP